MILENLQVVFFLKKLSEVPARDVWDVLGLGTPALVQESPMRKSGTASGSDDRFSYQVMTSPSRIDVTIAALPPTEPMNGPFGIANTAEAFDRATQFKCFFENGLTERTGHPNRLAIVGSFVEQFDSNIEANRKLIADTNLIRQDVESCTDLIFQINRRKESTTNIGVEINNLTTWQVLHVQNTVLLFAQLGEGTAPQQPVRESWLLRSKLDTNTVLEAKISADPTVLGKLFEELISRAKAYGAGKGNG